MGQEDAISVQTGNLMACRCAIILLIATARGLFWVLEQPQNSLFEHHPMIQKVLALIKTFRYSLKMGDYGGCSQKPTWLYSWHFSFAKIRNCLGCMGKGYLPNQTLELGLWHTTGLENTWDNNNLPVQLGVWLSLQKYPMKSEVILFFVAQLPKGRNNIWDIFATNRNPTIQNGGMSMVYTSWIQGLQLLFSCTFEAERLSATWASSSHPQIPSPWQRGKKLTWWKPTMIPKDRREWRAMAIWNKVKRTPCRFSVEMESICFVGTVFVLAEFNDVPAGDVCF